MKLADMTAFLTKIFPQVERHFEIMSLTDDGVEVRMKIRSEHLRPGGTVSGPSIFALADVSYYLATLSFIGPKALTVTTNCSIDFMRKPGPTDLLAKARVLKLGKTLSVGDVLIYSDGQPLPVARAGLTYAIPPQQDR